MSDRIEKQVVLKAPISRVWRAISDAQEFGKWFGVQLEGEFTPGADIRGTFGDGFNVEMIAEFQKKLGLKPSPVRMPEKRMLFCTIEKVESERYLRFRWTPFGIDAEADVANEPRTLVEFILEKASEGTKLTIVESGFDLVPAGRRERAWRMNDHGWGAQAQNAKRYVEG